jgi:hypothetical protein
MLPACASTLAASDSMHAAMLDSLIREPDERACALS